MGCNDGTFTRQIAKSFGCRLMLGVDIDARCIHSAWTHTPLIGETDSVSPTFAKTSGDAVRSVDDEEHGLSATSSGLVNTCSWLRADLGAEKGSAEDPFVGPLGASLGTFDTVFCLNIIVYLSDRLNLPSFMHSPAIPFRFPPFPFVAL